MTPDQGSGPRILGVLALLLVGAAPAALPQGEAGGEELLGSWDGGILQGTRSIRTSLHLARDEAGALGGTLDSPDQGVFGLGVAEVRLAGGTLAFRVPEVQASWSGHLDPETGVLVGTWSQRGAELPLDLGRVVVDPLVGSWEGLGDFGAVELRIRFHVGTKSDGSLGASLVSPDQSAALVPVAKVTAGEDGGVRFDVPAIGAHYEGQLESAEDRIEGALHQGGGVFPLVLERIDRVPVLRRPQTPEPPFPYRVEEVRYPNPKAGNLLAGTLTLPEGDGPFPAVLLITGSGAQDRNEEIFGHKPFLVIADHLTRAGIAVLRVDDRGIGGSTGDFRGATSADFATDVAAGVEFLKGRAEVRSDRIGLLGHSEGGLIAPLVAAERDDVAFLVLLAGPGQRGDALLLLQMDLLARAAGLDEAARAENRAVQEELFALVLAEKDPTRLRTALLELLEPSLGDAAAGQLETLLSPWYRFFLAYDPAPALKRVRCPVLALNGSKDLQVAAEENLSAIRAALEAGGNPDVTCTAYPGLNHLFQPCDTGAVTEYGQIETTIASEVLADLTAWVRERGKP